MARISRTGTTDSTGVASTTVTGTGGGRLKFISRNGELLSNEYSISDFLFYDNATSENHNTNWENSLNRLDVAIEDDGTRINRNGTANGYYIATRNAPSNFIVEFDVIERTALTYLTFNSTSYRVNLNSVASNGSHIKIEHTGKSNDIYVDGNYHSTVTSDLEVLYVALQCQYNANSSVVASLKFANFELYAYTPIKHYTPIALSSSASIIQTGESATLTAELTNVLGEKLANKSVNFIEKSKLIAEDKGTSATHTDLFGASTKSQINRLANYSELKLNDGQTGFASMTYSIPNAPIIFEIDMQIISQSTGWIATFRKSGGTITCGVSGANIGFSDENWHTLRFEVSYQQVDLYVDGEFEITRYPDAVFNYLEIDARDGSVINFKNFKVFQDTTIDTETSNSQGVASTTITSNQTGERQFITKADNIESEPITITDNGYIYSHEEEITSNTSTDNYKVITTLSELPSQFELTFDYKTNTEARVGLFSSNNFTGNPNYSVFVGSPNGSSSKYYGVRTTTTNTSDVNGSPTDYHSYLIRRDGDTFYFQIDGGTVYSKSANWFDNYTYVLGLMGWGTDKTSSVKNIILRSI